MFDITRLSTVKKVLMSLLIVGAATSVVSAGTFATFTAQTTNPSNTFATGTLVLSDTKSGGSACLSTGGGTTDTNANSSCDTLYNLTVKKPGDQGTVNLTLKNEGSLPATTFKVFSTACTNANAAGETYNGTGTPCTKVQLYVQEFSDSGFTTVSACRYGGASGNTCDFSNTAKTPGDFATNYTSSATGLALTGGLSAGGSRYFQIGVKLPSDADNTFQGRSASIGFSWYTEQ